MSGVLSPAPEQNSFRPPPEPVLSTTGVLKFVFLPKRSATAAANGKTVDEPTTLIWSRANANGVDTVDASATAAIAIRDFFVFMTFSILTSAKLRMSRY